MIQSSQEERIRINNSVYCIYILHIKIQFKQRRINLKFMKSINRQFKIHELYQLTSIKSYLHLLRNALTECMKNNVNKSKVLNTQRMYKTRGNVGSSETKEREQKAGHHWSPGMVPRYRDQAQKPTA